MKPKFGPAGNSDSFYAAGFKSTLDAPKWLVSMGLDAFEYQCGKGITIKEATARKIGGKAMEHGISLSVHAPYFINLATDDEEKRKKSISYITDTLEIASFMGASRIVVHSGSCTGMKRSDAFEYAKRTLALALSKADKMGFPDIHICPETMGKINQLGDLDEVLELCLLDERLIPTIDFGHLNARSLGRLKLRDDFKHIFDSIRYKLGEDRLKIFHSHFSKIEYTKGGEKTHLTFTDTMYGPEFDYVAEFIYKYNLSPTIICESKGTQAEDALTMKNMYLEAVNHG